jgi:hypothetical protein
MSAGRNAKSPAMPGFLLDSVVGDARIELATPAV